LPDLHSFPTRRSSDLRITILDWRQHRAPRQSSKPITIKVGQDGVEPSAHISAMKQVLGTERAYERVLHDIVRRLGIAGEGACIRSEEHTSELQSLRHL